MYAGISNSFMGAKADLWYTWDGFVHNVGP